VALLEKGRIMKVRDVLKRLRDDGWHVDRTRGTHRVLKHPTKTGIVVVAGHPNQDVAAGTLKSIWRQAELEEEA
jgi:predicted RNA binding protein YcfA (HicA-like mRNA interferase family)